MNENLGANMFEAVAKDVGELAAQTQRAGENIPNSLGKEITLAMASLATDLSAALLPSGRMAIPPPRP